MKICFLGSSHLTFHSATAAARRGWIPVFEDELSKADLVFIAQDTPTEPDGFRVMQRIKNLCDLVKDLKPIIQSQLPPGFCRSLGFEVYHQPETLRMRDASDKAMNPERIVIGCADPQAELSKNYQRYVDSFYCPVLKMTYEEAEFSKIAVNMALVAQVNYANRMKAACDRIGANWNEVKKAVHSDKRIGPYAYLELGHWQDSIHLLRDSVTLEEIENAR